MNGADVLYNLAVRLSFSTVGLSAGIASAVAGFKAIQSAATSAERDVTRAAASMEAAYMRVEKAAFQLNLAQKYGSTVSVIRNANNLNYAVDNQIAQIDAQMAAHKKMMAAKAQADLASGGFKDMLVGGAITGIGLIGANTMKDWVSAAASMEQSMNNVAIATGKASGNLNAIKDTAYQVSGQTQFSALDIMNMAQLAATNGLNNRTALNAALPILAKGAEVAMVERGVNYQQSIPAFVQLAHMANQYGVDPKTGKPTAQSQKSFNDMIDVAARSLLVSGGTPNELVSTMNYLKPVLANYGGKNFKFSDAIQLSALAENLGLAHGRGGSRLLAFFNGLAPTLGTRGGAFTHHNQSLTELMGFTKGAPGFWDKKGDFAGFTPAIETLMVAITNMKKSGMGQGNIAALMKSIFGSAGEVAASVFGSSSTLSQWGRINKNLDLTKGGIESTTKMQADIAATTASQYRILQTNLHNISIELGYVLLPAANGALKGLNGVAASLVKIGEQHPVLVKIAAITVAAVTGLSLFFGPLLLAVGAMQIFAAVTGTTVAAAFTGLLATTGTVALTITAFTSALLVFGTAGVMFAQGLNHIDDAARMAINPLKSFAEALGLIAMPKPHPSSDVVAYNIDYTKHHAGQVQATQTEAGTNTIPIDPHSIHIHMHGMDHQTQKSYTKAVVKEMNNHHRKTANKAKSQPKLQPLKTPIPIGVTPPM